MPKKVAGNTTVVYDGDALTGYLNQSSLQGIVNAIETTDFLDTAANTFIPGNATWTVPVGGPWDPTLDGYLGPDAVAPPAALKTLVVGIDTVTYTWTAAGAVGAFISNYTVEASGPAAAHTWSGTLQCSGAPVRA